MKSIHWQKYSSLKRATGHGLRLMLICLLVLLSTIFFLVSPVQAVPTIVPSSLSDGQVGVAYTATLNAVPLACPCNWVITSGAPPPGLTLDAATGTISGTPTTAGLYTFFVEVTDTTGTSPQQGFIITVTSPPLVFVTTSLPVATEGSSYTATLGVTGGTSPYTWTIVSGTLPTGLILGATTGFISGTPARGTAGSHSFIIGVTDSSSPALSGQQSFSITIEKGGYEPIVTIGSGLKAGETNISVGGSTVATLRGGESISLSFDLGTSQSIGVEPIVQHPTDTGVRFKAEVDRITVSEFSPNANFTYYTEYLIDLETEPSDAAQLTGSGWYKEGYTLRASAPAEVEVENKPGTQYRFSHWWLPTGETVTNKNLSLTVSAPGSCVANYDTYYQLTLTSPYGEPEGSTWYKAGSEAEWGVATDEVRMSGILGVFGGKLEAINRSGNLVMDAPRTITITWEPDYTMPLILIPLALLLIVLGIYGLYRLWRGPQPRPFPVAPPLQPIPPPPTTVVMIGDKTKQIPQTTREQLMEKFGELLEKYEDEIKTSIETKGAGELPKIETVGEEKRLAAPETVPPTVAEAEVAPEEEGASCSFTSRKLLRTVVSNWRQVETRTTDLPPTGKKKAEGGTGLAIVWARDIYQEWEILTCWLPRGHEGSHDGSVEIVYSLLNTVTEEKIYKPGQKGGPPEPHYTDGMPQVEIAAEQVIPPDQLPPETVS